MRPDGYLVQTRSIHNFVCECGKGSIPVKLSTSRAACMSMEFTAVQGEGSMSLSCLVDRG